MVPEIIITTVVAAILGNVPQITGVKNPKKDKKQTLDKFFNCNYNIKHNRIDRL